MSQASRTRAHQPKMYQKSIRTGLEARLATQTGLTSVPRRSMGASRASPGRLRAISERFGNPPGRSWDAPDAPQDVLERLLNALERPKHLKIDFGTIFERFGLSGRSPDTSRSGPFMCFQGRISPRRLTAFDRQNEKDKGAGFASVLRLAAQACLHELHDPPHNLRAID